MRRKLKYCVIGIAFSMIFFANVQKIYAANESDVKTIEKTTETEMFGEKLIDGKWYHFDEITGEMTTEWYDFGHKKVYYASTGEMLYGWQNIDGIEYYFDTYDGALTYGERLISGKWYHFDEETGGMTTGWYDFGYKKVYYASTGEMLYGWQNIDGIECYFDTYDGALASGEKLINGEWYLFDESTGQMITGWHDFPNKTVYYMSNGVMVHGEYKMDDHWYYFDSYDGSWKTGWVQLPEKKVYYNAQGEMQYGWLTLDGKEYYLDTITGAMAVGLCRISGHDLGFDESGAKIYGEHKFGEKWYCFDEKTGEMIIGWHDLGHKTVYYNQKGEMVYGEQKIDGYWYFFDTYDGAMTTGWKQLPEKMVYYDSNGHMLYGEQIIDGEKYQFDLITGAVVKNGWFYEAGYYFYYKNGVQIQDVRNIIAPQKNYLIKVNKQASCVTVYASDGVNGYIVPVVSFACSPGSGTPLGVFYTMNKYRWHHLYGADGQFCTRITGHILFHSPPYTSFNNYTLWPKEYNKLGSWASAGCIRLRSGDAKWIYDNCDLGTCVVIYNSSIPGPFDKPVYDKIPLYQTWDPTDPYI